MTFRQVIEIAREFASGKSVGRVLTNRVLARWRDDVKGTVLDLAAGASPSYWRVFSSDNSGTVRWVTVDLRRDVSPSVVADLTCPLPFRDGVADAVLLSGFLYIVPYPRELLSEVNRILKPSGTLILTAPLVFAYNPEPTDFWRFTGEGLRFLLSEAGFREFAIVPVGGRWTAAAYLIGPYLRPRTVIAPIVYIFCMWLDALAERFLRERLTPCPIGYCVRAKASRSEEA